MAYSTPVFKVISSFLEGTCTTGEAILAGAPIYLYSTDYLAYKADANNSRPMMAVALADAGSGETLRYAVAAVLEAQESISGSVYSAGSLAASTDVNSTLYLSDTAGQYSTSASASIAQAVGWIISTKRVFIAAQQYLSATSQTLSGTLAVTGAVTMSSTLEVTGASTLTGAVALNGGATVASGKNFTLTKGTLTNTEGNLVLTKGDATLTAGNLTLTLGDATLTEGALTLTKGNATLTAGNLTLTKGNATLTEGALTLTKGDATLTAGDLVLTDGYVKQVAVTALSADQVLTTAMCGNVSVATGSSAAIALTLPAAAAGLEYTIFQISGTKNIVITAGTGDYIIADNAADDNTATLTSCIGGSIVLRAMDATNWVVLGSNGTWGYTKV